MAGLLYNTALVYPGVPNKLASKLIIQLLTLTDIVMLNFVLWAECWRQRANANDVNANMLKVMITLFSNKHSWWKCLVCRYLVKNIEKTESFPPSWEHSCLCNRQPLRYFSLDKHFFHKSVAARVSKQWRLWRSEHIIEAALLENKALTRLQLCFHYVFPELSAKRIMQQWAEWNYSISDNYLHNIIMPPPVASLRFHSYRQQKLSGGC